MTSNTETRAVSTQIVDLRGWWDGSFPFEHSGFEISTTFSGSEGNGYTSLESANTVCVHLALDEIEAFLKAPFVFIRESKEDQARSSRVDLLGEYDHDDREYRRLSHYSAALQPDFGAAVDALRDGLLADLPGLFAQLREQVEAWMGNRRQGAYREYASTNLRSIRSMVQRSHGQNVNVYSAYLAKLDALYEALSVAYVEPSLVKAQECLSVG